MVDKIKVYACAPDEDDIELGFTDNPFDEEDDGEGEGNGETCV